MDSIRNQIGFKYIGIREKKNKIFKETLDNYINIKNIENLT